MPEHLDTFALTMDRDATTTAPRLATGTAHLAGLITAVLSYEATGPAESVEFEWATADGTVQHAVLTHSIVSLP